ncbi:MAG TPA: hypothetical protein PLQ88_01950, partial [Blastocatellia bacterium]|nr:hypothetical protein [Blastocatellia bacterium]
MFYQRILFAVLFCLLPAVANAQSLRLERLRLTPDTELLTVFGSFDSAKEEVPLLSVLFETLGDDDPANDRPRYLWSHTYAPPNLLQRAASAIPFFHFRVRNKLPSEIASPPAPLLDLQGSRSAALRKTFWALLQSIVLDNQGFAIRASTRSYRQNAADARQEQIEFALVLISALNENAGTSEARLSKLEARLLLAGGRLGAFIKDDALVEIADKRRSKSEEIRGHNWDLLRQRAEAEGLYFEPLKMPDGQVTHAVLWVARQDLNSNQKFNGQKFNGKFLNIKNPF